MFLEIHRQEFYPEDTIGGFYIDGVWFSYSLEDTDRRLEDGGIKIPKMTAIPRGKYKVTISWSTRFKRYMPHILDVPQFVGARIHSGNTELDTEGCPLIGYKYDAPNHHIYESKPAFDAFFPRLENGLKDGDVWLTVS